VAEDVLRVIDKLLAVGKVETARRVRQRLDAVFEYTGLTHGITINPVAIAKREIGKRIKAATRLSPNSALSLRAPDGIPATARAMGSYVGMPVPAR
jgi:hypothetical protein